jgi:hypothetical protein
VRFWCVRLSDTGHREKRILRAGRWQRFALVWHVRGSMRDAIKHMITELNNTPPQKPLNHSIALSFAAQDCESGKRCLTRSQFDARIYIMCPTRDMCRSQISSRALSAPPVRR